MPSPPHKRRKATKPPTGMHTDAHSADREGETKGKQPSALDPEQIIPIGEWANHSADRKTRTANRARYQAGPNRARRTAHAQATTQKRQARPRNGVATTITPRTKAAGWRSIRRWTPWAHTKHAHERERTHN